MKQVIKIIFTEEDIRNTFEELGFPEQKAAEYAKAFADSEKFKESCQFFEERVIGEGNEMISDLAKSFAAASEGGDVHV